MNRRSLTCPNGHHLRAAGALAGKTLPCPKCQAMVTIPMEEPVMPSMNSTAPRDPLSDTGVMRILGVADVAPGSQSATKETVAETTESRRPCPRCEFLVSEQSTVCPQCSCYMGMLPRFFRSLLPSNRSA
ncbi:ATP-binding protein [Rhodopirellula halodulae]|uniref:ATP-binding protein n=1 Tax=Rhodopirellula halodulae TaxID=2894198 RepID=UPI001E622D77|nr:ATP-binding protein [Rhodopirellula sp. JC737]MCC9655997.1 ATP-binding protein [Rhodopirellula sp. JC737]